MLHEFVRQPEQIPARVGVREGPDAETVGGVQLALQELAANVLDLLQLESKQEEEDSLLKTKKRS